MTPRSREPRRRTTAFWQGVTPLLANRIVAKIAGLALGGLAALLVVLAGAGAASGQTGATRPERPQVAYVALPPRALVPPVISCDALSGRGFGRVAEGPARITSARIEPAAGERAEFCLVKGYVAPTIQFELRLPTKTYTGRYLQGGCGGNCGMILRSISPGCDNKVAFGGAFAVGFEDSGHAGGDGIWALGGEQVRIDFAYRASHAFAHAAKAIIQTYYGQAPSYAYFQGCSDGGREGLSEAQRYPGDFDGIIAGAAAHIITQAMERFLWEARWGHDDTGRPLFDTPAVTALHAAVMTACDGLDGLKDGQIDDPRACRFDPGKIQCGAKRAAPCLSAEQVEAARRFYLGPVDPAGKHLYPGGAPYGGELTWLGRGSLSEAGLQMIEENVRTMTFLGDLPDEVDVRNWRFDEPTFRDLSRRGAIYNTDDPDLRPFRASGGKLILWYGLADPAAGAYALPDYYQRVQNAVGGLKSARSFARMFPVPGVYHCGGGYVPYEEDFLGAMVAWVETGRAPDSVIATAGLQDGAVRQRPIYAYPVRAAYVGKGDVNAAASFVGRAPQTPPNDRYDWLGASNRP